MKKIYLLIVLIISCTQEQSIHKHLPTLNYKLHFNFKEDVFDVTLTIDSLSDENDTFHFAASVPGTYEYLNFGRLVTDFKAFDGKNTEIKTRKDGLNKWILSEPEKVKQIKYKIDDSYERIAIQPMGGSNLKNDLALVNTFAVFGYFEGLQAAPIRLEIAKIDGWKIGTALRKLDELHFQAANYDELADSPILIGNLTQASTQINQTKIDIYVYSPNGTVSADFVLDQTKESIKSVINYIGFNATDRYTFLFNLLEPADLETVKFRNFGALEHSYSSVYVFPENQFINEVERVSGIMRHEFFHILTPLNLHSERIETFDFSEPKPSQHIWLYEGVTEWAALISTVTDSVSFKHYIQQIDQKIKNYKSSKNSASLVDIALHTYDDQKGQFQTFYEKGAVVAALLDLLILKSSNGSKNLRSVLIDLSQKYGANRGFSEDGFFDEFTKATYPEVGDFIEKYIDGTDDLPLEELFALIGVSYALGDSDPNPKTIGLKLRRKDGEAYHISGFTPDYQGGEVETGDILVSFDGSDAVNGGPEFFAVIDNLYKKYEIGDSYPLTVLRNGKKLELKSKLYQRNKSAGLLIDKSLTADQRRFRKLLYN